MALVNRPFLFSPGRSRAASLSPPSFLSPSKPASVFPLAFGFRVLPAAAPKLLRKLSSSHSTAPPFLSPPHEASLCLASAPPSALYGLEPASAFPSTSYGFGLVSVRHSASSSDLLSLGPCFGSVVEMVESPSSSDLPDNAHGLVPAASNFHCLLLATFQLLSSVQPTHRQLRGLSPKLFIPPSTGQRAAKAMHVTMRCAWVFLTAPGWTPFPSPTDCRASPRPCRPLELPSAVLLPSPYKPWAPSAAFDFWTTGRSQVLLAPCHQAPPFPLSLSLSFSSLPFPLSLSLSHPTTSAQAPPFPLSLTLSLSVASQDERPSSTFYSLSLSLFC